MASGAVLAFFITILAIWGLGSLKAQRGRHQRGGRDYVFHPLGFIIGSDDRLSLSRLQAFLWTMAIFGTYAAAWWGHQPVRWQAGDGVAQHADSAARRARETATQAHTMAIQAEVQARLLTQQANEAAARLPSIPSPPVPTDSARMAVDALQRQAAAAAATAGRARDTDRVATATAEALEEDAARYKWVAIPAALLALAGISIGSGVFSTLIAAGNSSGVSPCVTSLRAERYATLAGRYPKLGMPRDTSVVCAVIYGSGLGRNGRVRLDGDFADILFWADDGTTIVTVPPAPVLRSNWAGTLIVDTANGKASYGTKQQPTVFSASTVTASLGSATDALEWSDLFRNDSDPTNLDLMKFQMFGWTLIGVSLYLWNFFSVIARYPFVVTLPALDPSLVTLTGVSQAAYLTNKGVQGGQPSPDRTVAAPPPPAPAAPLVPPAPPVRAAAVEPPVTADRSVPSGLIPPSLIIVLVALAMSSTLGAQVVRRNDVLAMDDWLLCSQPHYYGASGASSSSTGLIPSQNGKTPSTIVAVHGAATANAARRGDEGRHPAALAQVRLSAASMKPCRDAWAVHLDGILADGGGAGGALELATPGLPFGRRGDNGTLSVGSVGLHAGASATRRTIYDPAVDLHREAWAGMLLKLDLPGKLWLPGLGVSDILLHPLLAVQGNYAWDGALRTQRGQNVVPELNVALPISVMREVPGINLQVVGIGYSYDRIQHEAGDDALVRQVIGLTTAWFGKRLDVEVQGGTEKLGGTRLYKVIGVALRPRGCTICQTTF
jgi:hypothetical protein